MDEVLFRYNRIDQVLSHWAHRHNDHIVIEAHFDKVNEHPGVAALIQVQDQGVNPLALDKKQELTVEAGEMEGGRGEQGVEARGAEASWLSASASGDMLVNSYGRDRGKGLVSGGEVRGGRWVVGR